MILRLIFISLLLASCSQRTEPPAPILDKRADMERTKLASKKILQSEMISKLIEKYGDHHIPRDQDNVSESPFPAAKVVTTPTPSSQKEVFIDDDLPQPLKKVPAPLGGGIQEMPLDSSPKIEEEPTEKIQEQPIIEQEQKPLVPLSGPIESKLPKEELIKPQFSWPLKGKVVKSFGAIEKDGSTNDGINIEAPEGSPVMAVADGTVGYSTNQLKGFGNLIFIKHENNIISVYAHLKDIHVVKGDKIKKGQRIGTVGKTGTVKTAQLHFEIRKKTKSIDPLSMLDSK